MYEYTLAHLTTHELEIIHGYNLEDACDRCGIVIEKYEILWEDYID